MKKSSAGKSDGRRRRRRGGDGKVRIAIAFLILILSLWIIVPSVVTRLELRAETQRSQRELRLLRTRNAELRERMKRLNDKSYLELVARRDLGLIKPGEIPYLVVPEKAKPKAPKPRKKQRTQPPVWQPVVDFFENLSH